MENRVHMFSSYAHLLPQSFSGGQAGAGGHKPAVSQLALVQVVRADAIHKQMGVAAQLLPGERTKIREDLLQTGT